MGRLSGVICAVGATISAAICPTVGYADGWTAKTAMPTARTAAAAGVIAGKLHIAGGACCGIARIAVHEAYDPATDSWTTKAPMLVALSWPAVGVIAGKLYIAGGAREGGSNVATLQVYDAASNTWTMKSSLPTGRVAAAAGVVGTKLYVAGGHSDFTPPLADLFIYDSVNDTWATGAPMPTARTPTGAVVNGIFYAVGGVSSSAYLNTVEAYDPATNTWTAKAPMPTARNGHSIEVIDGILYAIGGYTGSAYVNTVEAYNPVTDTWTTEAPMPTARNQPAVGVVNATLYAAGGEVVPGHATNVLEAYTPFLAVAIDIKPGSDPNSINLGSAGVVPVAILSGQNFDATLVDPESVTLAGAAVRLIGRGSKYACSSEDQNGDGRLDLVCHVETAQFLIEPGSTSAELMGKTFAGQRVRGTDSIHIVQ